MCQVSEASILSTLARAFHMTSRDRIFSEDTSCDYSYYLFTMNTRLLLPHAAWSKFTWFNPSECYLEAIIYHPGKELSQSFEILNLLFGITIKCICLTQLKLIITQLMLFGSLAGINASSDQIRMPSQSYYYLT